MDIGTRRAPRVIVIDERVEHGTAGRMRIWIVEDEPAAASLAADLCEANGATPSLYRLPLTFLTALRTSPPPEAVVLDWRLEHELSAGPFLATRHRYPRLPVIYWTGSMASVLPAMISDDRWTLVIEKAAGTAPFEEALAWALHRPVSEAPTGSAVG